MISAIILAAGLSTRMGTTKQLLKIGDKSMIRMVVENVLASSVDEIIVVTGNQADCVNAEIYDLPIKVVFNPNFARGQGTSLAMGAGQIDCESEAVLIFMADQPFISGNIIDYIIKNYLENHPGIKALRPVFNNRPGHPVIFDCSLKNRLMTLHEDQGARAVFDSLGSKKLEITVNFREVVLDADTPEEFLALKESGLI